MNDPLIGQISILSFNWAPNKWAFCDGTLLGVSYNAALFSLLGIAFGGDGRSSFGLPDLRGRAPIHYSTAPPPGFQFAYPFSSFAGSEITTLTVGNLPPHFHNISSASVGTDITTTTIANSSGLTGTVRSFGGPPSTNNPSGTYNAITLGGNSYSTAQNAMMANGNVDISGSVAVSVNSHLTNGSVTGITDSIGSGQPISNLQPFLALNFVIALDGTYPSRP